MATRVNPLVKLFWRVHPKLYGLSNGRIGGSIMGLPVLLLTTTGRKTGQLRTKALRYLPQGEDFVVIASNLGQEHHPAWWLNLKAQPNASVQVGKTHHPVQAREAEGEERERIWRTLTDKVPAYDGYRTRTTRRFPVVVLEVQ